MNQEIKKIFCDLLGEDRVFTDEPMKQHTTFKIGGPADYFLVPESGEEAGEIIKICKQTDIPYFILGNGSNLLLLRLKRSSMKRLSSTQSSIHTPSAWSISTTILLSVLISTSTRKYSLSSSQLSTISLTVFLFIIHFVWGVQSCFFLFIIATPCCDLQLFFHLISQACHQARPQ